MLHPDVSLLLKILVEDLNLDIPIVIHRKDVHNYKDYLVIYNAGGNATVGVDRYIVGFEVYSDNPARGWDIITRIRVMCNEVRNEFVDGWLIIQINDYGLPTNNPDNRSKKVSFVYNIQILVRNYNNL